MRKNWLALLSVIGFAGTAAQAPGQVLKGSHDMDKVGGGQDGVEGGNGVQNNNSQSQKLQLNQQTLRQQNRGAHAKKGAKNALTKANTQISATCGNSALTKGSNAALTKANNAALTKANNAALTKGGNSALTKANTAR